MTPPDPVERNGEEDSREPFINWEALEQWIGDRRPDELSVPLLRKEGIKLGIFSEKYYATVIPRCMDKDIRNFMGRYRTKIQAKDASGNPVGKLPYQSVLIPNPNPEGDSDNIRVYKREVNHPEEYADLLLYWRHVVRHGIHQLSQSERHGLKECGAALLLLIPAVDWEQIRRLIAIEQDGGDGPFDGLNFPDDPLPPGLNG